MQGRAALAPSEHGRAQPSKGLRSQLWRAFKRRCGLMGKPTAPAASPRVPPCPRDACPASKVQQCQALQKHKAKALPATSLQGGGDASARRGDCASSSRSSEDRPTSLRTNLRLLGQTSLRCAHHGRHQGRFRRGQLRSHGRCVQLPDFCVTLKESFILRSLPGPSCTHGDERSSFPGLCLPPFSPHTARQGLSGCTSAIIIEPCPRQGPAGSNVIKAIIVIIIMDDGH